MTIVRMTSTTAAVLQALAAGHRYGFDIAEATGLRGGTVYPLLRRLEAGGLVDSHWEEAAIARGSGRPSRKYYQLRPSAKTVLRTARERYPVVLKTLTPQTFGGEGRA